MNLHIFYPHCACTLRVNKDVPQLLLYQIQSSYMFQLHKVAIWFSFLPFLIHMAGWWLKAAKTCRSGFAIVKAVYRQITYLLMQTFRLHKMWKISW